MKDDHALEAVAQRQERQRHVVLESAAAPARRPCMFDDEVGVRQHHALRLAGRARGVDDRRELHRAARARARSLELLPGAPLARHARDARARARSRTTCTDGLSAAVHPSIRITASSAAAGGGRPGSSRAVAGRDDGGLRAGVLQDVARLRRGERRIDRHRDRAGGKDREVGDQPLRPALGHDRDAIAGADAERAQARARASRMRSKSSLLESQSIPSGRQRPMSFGFGNRPRHVKRQVGDGVDVNVRTRRPAQRSRGGHDGGLYAVTARMSTARDSKAEARKIWSRSGFGDFALRVASSSSTVTQ